MDWRKDFLYIVEDTVGYSFQKKFFLTTKDNDHTHCAICWKKIGCSDDSRQDGYYCKANSYWLCCECFFDFKKQYKWKEEGAISKTGDG